MEVLELILAMLAAGAKLAPEVEALVAAIDRSKLPASLAERVESILPARLPTDVVLEELARR